MDVEDDDMKEAAYIKAFKEFATGDPTLLEYQAMEKELHGGSDRAAVVLLAALNDVALKVGIKSTFKNQNEKALFGASSPLASFSAKIALGYALGLFGPKTRHDLTIIREMRNQFAHSRKALTFEMAVVAEMCENLSLPKTDIYRNTLPAWTFAEAMPSADYWLKPKTKFFGTSNTIGNRLIRAAFFRGLPSKDGELAALVLP